MEASNECFVEVPNVSVKVTSLEAFVEASVKDCVNGVFTEVFVEVTPKHSFVKVTSMESFSKISWKLLSRKLPWKRS